MTDDYSAFRKWYETLNWIMDRTEKYPKDVRFSFTNRILSIAVEILERLIEAIYTREKVENLKSINLSVEKLRIFFRLSHDRKYIAMNQYEYIATQLDEFGKMIGGWLKTCEG